MCIRDRYKTCSNDSTRKLQELSVYHRRDPEDDTNFTEVGSSTQSNIAISAKVDKSNNSNPKHSLMKHVLPNDTETLIQLFNNIELKQFSRSYILSHMLQQLNESENESDYTKYFRHLCFLENYPKKNRAAEESVDLHLSLFNSWCLSKNRTPSEFKINQTNLSKGHDHMMAKENPVVNRTIYLERKQTIELLLKNVLLDDRFANYLEKLYECERNQDNDNVNEIKTHFY